VVPRNFEKINFISCCLQNTSVVLRRQTNRPILPALVLLNCFHGGQGTPISIVNQRIGISIILVSDRFRMVQMEAFYVYSSNLMIICPHNEFAVSRIGFSESVWVKLGSHKKALKNENSP
ncbi:MAG: hypothetical protein MJA29_08880, partial [Candidatus Omnitrophica bacterium]|nr:hypothetical protein [Candidatus Omnitrophota bacterium]